MSLIKEIVRDTKAVAIPEDYKPQDIFARKEQPFFLADFRVCPQNQNLKSLLLKRKSSRTYGTQCVSRECLLETLMLAYGYKSKEGGKTVPSAGSLYPLKLYCLVNNVSSFAPGIYRFDDYLADFIPLLSPSEAVEIEKFFQTSVINFSAVSAILLITADLSEGDKKYGPRSYRYSLLEAGHVGQNICLALSALNIPHVPLGGFDDEGLTSLLGITSDMEFILYSTVIGMKNE